ncbi:hypothetical protein [Loktanella sp. SALINAS62]|uniref:hypothetical protein n=1 Tax=Loktanella sp. SALINAS62 TaxID=2706124 RepID=UPI001B8C8756|nr:hypothetical protein [Loktanella sp. SALINAS62]MBS1302412.1 hypothetical protein [Loktanella sp. SALINAS62]
MSPRVILWGSVAILLIGTGILTLPLRANLGDEGLHWLVPLAYFLMLFGAIGLAVGWFRKKNN